MFLTKTVLIGDCRRFYRLLISIVCLAIGMPTIVGELSRLAGNSHILVPTDPCFNLTYFDAMPRPKSPRSRHDLNL